MPGDTLRPIREVQRLLVNFYQSEGARCRVRFEIFRALYEQSWGAWEEVFGPAEAVEAVEVVPHAAIDKMTAGNRNARQAFFWLL